MGSFYQDVALDCYQGVRDQGEYIQVSRKNLRLLLPFDTKLGV
jgi:hypothetical protein